MNKYKFLLTLMLPMIVALSGCEKFEDFGSTNVNPGATNTPIVGALMTNVQSQLGGYASSTRGGLYAQYISETQYTDVSLYSLPQLNLNGEYAGVLYDLQNIINQNVSNNQNVVARILQQYIFWMITDRWGDAPYSEALQGKPTPKYDRQEDIYKGMISTLKTAITEFDNASFITGDVIYNGSVAAWKKLANSLRMLMALRLTKANPALGKTEFDAALRDPGGYIATNADNFTLRYPGGNFKNPWYNTYNGRKDFGESAPMVTLLNSFGDARQTVFGGKIDLPDKSLPDWDDPSSVGMPYGLTRAKSEAFTAANPTWARILRPSYREENDPLVLIGAAHVALARAQAADMGWTTEILLTVYMNGINLSFEQWGLPAPAAAYFTQAGVALTAPAGTGGNKQQIAIQRYIAAYPDGLQGWSIWRETGFPVLTPAPDATNSSRQIPRRYTYGQAEYGTNSEATKAAAEAMGGDTQDTKVWWDK